MKKLDELLATEKEAGREKHVHSHTLQLTASQKAFVRRAALILGNRKAAAILRTDGINGLKAELALRLNKEQLMEDSHDEIKPRSDR